MKNITIEALRSLDKKSFKDIAEYYNAYPDVLEELIPFPVNDIITCISDMLVKQDNLNKLEQFLQKGSDDDSLCGFKIVTDAIQKDITHLQYKLGYLFKSLEDDYYYTSYEMTRMGMRIVTGVFPGEPISEEAEEKIDKEMETQKLVCMNGKLGLGDMYRDILKVLESHYIGDKPCEMLNIEHTDYYETVSD